MIGWLWRLRERRRIRATFAEHLSPEYIRLLESDPRALKLGGETKDASVLVCTLNGLVELTGGMKGDPRAVAALIDRILAPAINTIIGNDGMVDGLVGSRFSAGWNAFGHDAAHPAKACASALFLWRAIEHLDAELRHDGDAQGATLSPLGFGIGVNTGRLMVGNIGSGPRFWFTLTGDPALLAAAFSEAGPLYGVPVVIGADMQRQVLDFATIELDTVWIKGRPDLETIHGLIGDPELANDAEFQALRDLHQRMLVAYNEQRWNEATALVRECKLKERWGLAKLYDMYTERIASRTISLSSSRFTPPPA